jgi:hypothetical protein
VALAGVKKGQGEMTSEMDEHFALASCLRMMFSENRHPLFGIMR